MAFAESELLPISALQHLLFCERQFALIHVEGIWTENWHTARGRIFHERAHGGQTEVRGTMVRRFGVPIRSTRLGLSGITDAVEFHYSDGSLSRLVDIIPVEYKVGSKKNGLWDVAQVAAQGVCLEEMTGVAVREVHLYYGKNRRRNRVELDHGIRSLVERAAGRVHELIEQAITPVVRYRPDRCDACSLFDICRPRTPSGRGAASYLLRAISEAMQDREG